MNEGIKKWTVSLLLMLMLLQSNQIVAVYFHFLLHRAEVIALFCAPRHSDESTCNGQCFLNEQISRGYKTGELFILNDLQPIQVAFPAGALGRPRCSQPLTPARMVTSTETCHFLPLFSIFRPPKLR